MTEPWNAIIWIVGAGLIGFAVSALFAGALRLSRRVFLVPYLGLISALLYAFFRWGGTGVDALLPENWPRGAAAGLVASAILVRNVASQPRSPRPTGAALAVDVAWLGLAYGTVDALYLNVVPVLAVWAASEGAGWVVAWPGRVGLGALALGASLFVTAAYHVGYPEFRNRSVGLVLVGNAVITLAFLLSGSPLAAVISHTAMHVAAVLRGPESTLQLPPHHGGPTGARGPRPQPERA